MARNQVLQFSCSDKLKKDIERYQNEKKLDTTAEATRELLEFALRILLNSKENEGVTNRELMEEVLRLVQYTSMTTNVVHGQTFNMDHLVKNKSAASELRTQLKEDAESKVAGFLKNE